jgi:hypothetical protein
VCQGPKCHGVGPQDHPTTRVMLWSWASPSTTPATSRPRPRTKASHVARSTAGVLWTCKTGGYPGARAVNQTYGNFVVYLKSRPLWHTHTNDKTSGGTLVMQNDSNLVLTRGGVAIWGRSF